MKKKELKIENKYLQQMVDALSLDLLRRDKVLIDRRYRLEARDNVINTYEKRLKKTEEKARLVERNLVLTEGLLKRYREQAAELHKRPRWWVVWVLCSLVILLTTALGISGVL